MFEFDDQTVYLNCSKQTSESDHTRRHMGQRQDKIQKSSIVLKNIIVLLQ
jgi:hypothetical protein